jgi:hypothetical protein
VLGWRTKNEKSCPVQNVEPNQVRAVREACIKARTKCDVQEWVVSSSGRDEHLSFYQRVLVSGHNFSLYDALPKTRIIFELDQEMSATFSGSAAVEMDSFGVAVSSISFVVAANSRGARL